MPRSHRKRRKEIAIKEEEKRQQERTCASGVSSLEKEGRNPALPFLTPRRERENQKSIREGSGRSRNLIGRKRKDPAVSQGGSISAILPCGKKQVRERD